MTKDDILEMLKANLEIINSLKDKYLGQLIETAEKAAEIYLKIAHLPLVNTITDEQMHLLEQRFGVKGREGYLA